MYVCMSVFLFFLVSCCCIVALAKRERERVRQAKKNGMKNENGETDVEKYKEMGMGGKIIRRSSLALLDQRRQLPAAISAFPCCIICRSWHDSVDSRKSDKYSLFFSFLSFPFLPLSLYRWRGESSVWMKYNRDGGYRSGEGTGGW